VLAVGALFTHLEQRAVLTGRGAPAVVYERQVALAGPLRQALAAVNDNGEEWIALPVSSGRADPEVARVLAALRAQDPRLDTKRVVRVKIRGTLLALAAGYRAEPEGLPPVPPLGPAGGGTIEPELQPPGPAGPFCCSNMAPLLAPHIARPRAAPGSVLARVLADGTIELSPGGTK